MKSTYKLFGTIWDGIDADKYRNELCKCIFTENNKKAISFKTLLSINTHEEVIRLASDSKCNDYLLIDIDYWCINNQILASFLRKRLFQMAKYLEEISTKKVKIAVSVKNADPSFPRENQCAFI